MRAARPRLVLLAAIAAIALLSVLTYVRYNILPARGVDAAGTEFSSGRAVAALTRVLDHQFGHATGTLSNARVRDRLVATLEGLGYAPRVTRRFACGAHGACSFVENILCERAGASGSDAVLLSAHYDSVPAAQGAFDDGTGVAVVLEVARALRSLPTPAHSVMLLLTDGEERGLLGAESFASDDTNFTRVRAVVNVDARGSDGPAMLFETSHANAFLMSTVAPRLERPVTSSLFAAIYERMPNDTDFTVLKRGGAIGANFAAIGNISHYHTPLDRLTNLNLGTLQHAGSNVLATTWALANTSLNNSADVGSYVWFDVLALFVCAFPSWVAVMLAILGALLLGFATFRALRHKALTFAQASHGALAALVSVALATLVSFALSLAVNKLHLLPAPWIAHPFPLLCAFGLVGLFAVAASSRIFVARATALGMWFGTWIVWTAFALVLAITVPGASYIFVVPVFAAGLVSLFWKPEISATRTIAFVVKPLAFAFLVWLPLLLQLSEALGFTIAPVHGIAWAFAFTTLLPAFALQPTKELNRVNIAGWTAAAACFVAACFQPPFTAQHPSRANVVFHQDAVSGNARLVLDTTWSWRPFGVYPDAMRRAMHSAHEDVSFPWYTSRALVESTPRIAANGPEVSVLSDRRTLAQRDLRIRVTSQRQAQSLVLLIAPGTDMRVMMANQLAATPRYLPSGWAALMLYAVPPEGVELFLSGSIAPAEAVLLDVTPGVPEAAARLVRARPRDAVQSQDGDVTVVSRRLLL